VESALYYPFIQIRDDEWLKLAALYWPALYRLVPHHYTEQNSPTERALVDASVLKALDPRATANDAAEELAVAAAGNAELLARDYSIERAYADWDGSSWAQVSQALGERPGLAWLDCEKFSGGIVGDLENMGLGRPSYGGADPDYQGEWVGLHPTLATAYMIALAGKVGAENHCDPVTDEVDLRVAAANDDAGAALQLLLGSPGVKTKRKRRSGSSGTGVPTYVMLALQHARPRNLASIPVETVLKCRETLQSEFGRFRAHVDQQREELAQLAAIPHQERQLEAFAQHVQLTIEGPLRDLEKALRLHKLEPTRTLMLTSSIGTPAVAGLALSAAGAEVTAAAGVVAAIGGAWWGVSVARKAEKDRSAVGFLLDVRDQLTAPTLANRVRHVLLGTYGR
jgi:hypothetical protein